MTSRPASRRSCASASAPSGTSERPIAYRTIACLPALAGSWRHRGGGFSYIPIATMDALDVTTLRRPDLLPGPVRTINMARLGEALTDPELDPPVAALVGWNTNPAAIAPDQEQVLRGLAREDLFTVVLEQFPTDTTLYADVVLPATTQLEHLDLFASWGHHYLTWNEPAIAPVGEAKPNTEIFRLLAGRLGLDDPCFRETDGELLASVLSGGVPGVDPAMLRAQGYAKVDLGLGVTPHAVGAFTTPSGKVELRASSLGEHGLDPLPFFDPPAEATDPELAARYPLCLITSKTHLFLNSSFANGERQAAAQPAPYVVVHPDDAARAASKAGRRCACSTTAARSSSTRSSPMTSAPASRLLRWVGGAGAGAAGEAVRQRRRSF